MNSLCICEVEWKTTGSKMEAVIWVWSARGEFVPMACISWIIWVSSAGEQVGALFSPCCVSCCIVPLKSCDPWWPRLLCSFLLLLSCRWPCKGWVCIYNWNDKVFCTSILFLVCYWEEEKKIASSSDVLHWAAKRESIFMKHYSKKGNFEVHCVEYLQQSKNHM